MIKLTDVLRDALYYEDAQCDGRAMLTYIDECGGCATMRTWYGRDADGAT